MVSKLCEETPLSPTFAITQAMRANARLVFDMIADYRRKARSPGGKAADPAVAKAAQGVAQAAGPAVAKGAVAIAGSTVPAVAAVMAKAAPAGAQESSHALASALAAFQRPATGAEAVAASTAGAAVPWCASLGRFVAHATRQYKASWLRAFSPASSCRKSSAHYHTPRG